MLNFKFICQRFIKLGDDEKIADTFGMKLSSEVTVSTKLYLQ